MHRDPLGYYAWLGIPPEATAKEVKAAFRARARRLHPDVAGTGSAEAFRRLSEAYHVLSDANRRARYDRTALEPEAVIVTGAAPVREPPPTPKPRSFLPAALGGGFGLALVAAAAFLLYRALASAPPPPRLHNAAAPRSTFETVEASPAPDRVPALGGEPSHYILPGGGPAVLWSRMPGGKLTRLGALPPFTPVHAEPLVVDGLQAVTLANGRLAYLDSGRLMPGDRQDAEKARCAYIAGTPPSNGEVLARESTGAVILTIINLEPSAAVVTLAEPNGALAVRVFVAPRAQARIGGLPAGPLTAKSSFGELWSRGCGTFVADARSDTFSHLVQTGAPLVISLGG
ncbi:MAG TPA: J domain-containing protein [Acetobacteraceae bacterium]|nr:J domain-containing protein [Acetobacteraceae bacterium]